MGYGIKVYDTSGNSTVLTPQIANIVATGNITMSNSLNGDNTYGTDIALSSSISVNNIAVIAYPIKVYFQSTIASWYWTADGSYPFTWYASPSITYYTKDSAGVMTAWSAGNLTVSDATTWDGMCCAFPLAGWDYTDATTTVSNIRIWAAMAHIVYDASASAFKTVYTIGNKGVESVDYIIFLKNT